VIVLDTTVLVYALGRDHPLREPCRQLVVSVGQGQVRATTSVETIQEFCQVRSRRNTPAQAAADARDHALLLRPLLLPEEIDLVAGLSAFGTNGGRLGSFDAVLGASAARRGLPLASADRGFDLVPGLIRLDPASPSFLEDCLAHG